MAELSSRLLESLSVLAQRFAAAARPEAKLVILWDIGNQLKEQGLSKPHAIGVVIQQKTRGYVTRAIVFRGAKAREIWDSPQRLADEVKGLRSIQYFYDMIALLDPSTKNVMSPAQRTELFRAARTLDTRDFSKFLKALKLSVSSGTLGNRVVRKGNWAESDAYALDFQNLKTQLERIVASSELADAFRTAIPEAERDAFVNFVIAMAAPQSIALRKSSLPSRSSASDQQFRRLYDYFQRLSSLSDDRERSRLRKRVGDEALARVSSMMSALRDENSRDRFLKRSTATFNVSDLKR